MKKFIFGTIVLLIVIIIISTILLFRMEAVSSEIRMNLNLAQKNQLDTKEILSAYNLQLNTKIAELAKDTDRQNNVLCTALEGVRNSTLIEIGKVKSLLLSYTEEVKTEKAAERLLAVNALVESDNLTQQLLGEGSARYEKEDFTAAVKVYKKILDIDSTNTEALCYFNASLYYRNPGDGSNFSGIKNDLVSLLEEKALSKYEELTALNVLMGISREEGNAGSLKKYQDALQKLKEDPK